MANGPTDAPSYVHGRPAGFISRAVAFVLDLILISVLVVLVTQVLRLIDAFFVLSAGSFGIFGDTGLLSSAIAFASAAFTTLVMAAYFPTFWALTGFTPGKALLGLKTVRRDGQPLSVVRAIMRFVGYFVSAAPLFLGFAWILVDRRRECWHDKIADTHVVYGSVLNQPPNGTRR